MLSRILIGSNIAIRNTFLHDTVYFQRSLGLLVLVSQHEEALCRVKVVGLLAFNPVWLVASDLGMEMVKTRTSEITCRTDVCLRTAEVIHWLHVWVMLQDFIDSHILLFHEKLEQASGLLVGVHKAEEFRAGEDVEVNPRSDHTLAGV